MVEDKVRIVDQNDKIGFANREGIIIIKPQFEIATSFFNGKAIIAATCKKTKPDGHEHQGDCDHSYLMCNQHGYINEKGMILKIGNFTFEENKEEIGWKASTQF